MQVIDFTDSVVFNYFFSFFVYLTALIAPLFAALSLTRN